MSERGRTGRKADRHSDLGPSSKDWQPGSAGRDSDFTPEKDLWTAAHKGSLGAGRPGEDVHSESASSAQRHGSGGGIQPGTQREGRSWQSRRPEPGNEDDKLDQALKDTFPTSDPPQPAQPGITGWDLGESDRAYRVRGNDDWSGGRGWVRTASAAPAWAVAGLVLLPALAWVAYSLRPSRRSQSQPQPPQSDLRQDEWSADRRPPPRAVI